MKKLTKKEYISRLSGTYFVACCHNVTVEEVVQSIASQPTKELPIVYKVDKVQLRSRDMVIYYSQHTKGKENGKSYRQFHGKNEYFAKEDLLIHTNTQDGHVCVFLNL